jgi:GTP-binding protein
MTVPKVAIVGRPNVGKSSIMNWLAHKRVSVVDPMAGVTRDRVSYLMHVSERYFELVDTGGIGIVDVGDLSEEIDTQIRIGIEEADLILFVVDGTAGITALDEESLAACASSTSRRSSSSTNAIPPSWIANRPSSSSWPIAPW